MLEAIADFKKSTKKLMNEVGRTFVRIYFIRQLTGDYKTAVLLYAMHHKEVKWIEKKLGL